jgi:hypothetical protein
MVGKRISTLIACLACVLAGCGGGGGGGGGGRTTETAIRLIHGAIDGPPVEVLHGSVFIQSARFTDVTGFVPVDPGPNNISVQRANSPGVTQNSLSQTLAEDTEYTVLIFSDSDGGQPRASLFEEPVVRPAAGLSRVQLINALLGSSPLELVIGGAASARAGYGTTSGFIEVGSGAQLGSVRNAAGQEVASLSLTLVDRGELTIVLIGSVELGQAFVRLYEDLD